MEWLNIKKKSNEKDYMNKMTIHRALNENIFSTEESTNSIFTFRG